MTENNIVPVDGSPKAYKDVFELANELDETQVFIKPNCKLCNSPNRSEAEAHCERSNWNYSQTSNFLKAKGESISDKAIKNHVEDHYRPQIKRIQVKHYCNDLATFMQVRKDHRKTLEIMQAALLKSFLELASTMGGLTHFDALKTSDIMVKLTGQIAALIKTEKELDGQHMLIHVAAEKLNQIVTDEMKTATPEVQQRLNKVVMTFLENLEDMSLDSK